MLTQGQCEDNIMRLVARMESLTEELSALARDAAEAEANHKMCYAKVFLEEEGSVTQREQRATLRTHVVFRDRKIKEALYSSCREALHTTDSALNAMRTIAANIRGQT